MLPQELWRLGTYRGEPAAIRGSRSQNTRERHPFYGYSEAEAAQAIERLNAEILTGGSTKITAILDYYKNYKERNGKLWRKDTDGRCDALLRDAFGHMEYFDLGNSDCEDYADRRRDLGYSENTIRLELAHLRASINRAAKDKRYPEVEKRLVNDLYVPSSDAFRDRVISRPDYEKLLGGAEAFHVKLYLILSIATLGRPQHLLALQWSQIGWENRLINLAKPGERVSNKRKAIVPINDQLYEHLTMAYPIRRTQNVIEFNGRPIDSIRNGLRAAAERANLDHAVSPYDIRHTGATWMAMAGIPLKQIALLLGDNLKTVEKHYLHYTPEFLKDATNVLQVGVVRD